MTENSIYQYIPKVDITSDQQTITPYNQWVAKEQNRMINEINNLINSGGEKAKVIENDDRASIQQANAVLNYSLGANYYEDESIQENNIILNNRGTFVNPTHYFNGMTVMFLAKFNNTSSDIYVNVCGLGEKPIYKNIDFDLLLVDTIKQDRLIELVYLDLVQGFMYKEAGSDKNEGDSFPLLTPHFFPNTLNEVSWLRSDTFSWQSGKVYVSAYNKLVEEKNSANKIGQYEPIVLPTFTSNTQDGITISDSRDNTIVLRSIFNGTNERNQIGAWNTYWINIDYGKDTLIKSYVIQADNSGSTAESPTAWTLQGYNGTDWEIIDTQENIVFSLNELKTFNVNTENYYTQYRIVFNAGNGSNGELKKVSFNADYVSLVYYKSTNGFNIVDPTQEQNIIDLFNNTGITWFYILDETNKQFKLPRTKYNFVGYRNNVGGYVEESLPNITGSISYGGLGGIDGENGALYNTAGTGNNHQSTAQVQGKTINFDASRSSPTYQNGAPVQQRATEMYLYFYVGNTVRNQTEIDVGTITEELNNKVDVSDVKNICIGYPDYSAGISLVFNQENTMPANGWLEITGLAFYGANVIISINGVQKIISTSANQNYSCTVWVIIPVSVGDIVQGINAYQDGSMIFYPNK